MTARESVAYSIGRDSAHCERPSRMTDRERASYPSQRSQARLLRYRVGARMRKDMAQGRGQR